MRVTGATVVLFAALTLAACDRGEKSAPPPPVEAPAASDKGAMAQPRGFRHEEALDISGYFMPKSEIKAGNYRLTTIAGGAPSDFRTWESGKREGLFGPLMVQFEDVTSPTATNELGGEHPTVQVRVLPDAYQLTKAAVAFHGTDPTLGSVTFAGAFNQKALAQAKTAGTSDGKVVLKGDLQVGAQRFHDVAFTFWAGE